MPEHLEAEFKKSFNLKSESDCMVKVVTELIHDLKNKFGHKSETVIEVINIIAPHIEGETVANIMGICKVNFENAKKIKNRVKLSRKVYKKKITQEIVNNIQNFYIREDISRVNTKVTSKKYGSVYNMNFSVKDAYITFKSENPEIQVSYSKFNLLRPKNVKVSSETPLVSCLCPYCINIRIKLQKLRIPDLKMEYDLFNKLVCKVNHKQILENESCIAKTCQECSDWEGKIENLLSAVANDNKNITWYTWQKEEITKRNGKKVVCRNLVSKTASFEVFKRELINDVLHPTQRVTFVEHFMAQKIQHKMYNDCYSYLKPGQCIMVQDFSKNREIVLQEEIKENYFAKKQVTMHPTVLFYRLEKTGNIQKLVVTHLSDIMSHDAHLVHYITQDCISALKDQHPTIEWKKIYIWSDGCAAQYKGKTSFYYLDKYSVPVERIYFASEHGKGPSDAETGLISMKLSDAIKNRRVVIKNGLDMHGFLEDSNTDCRRIFKLVKPEHIEPILQEFNGINVNTLKGNCTRSLHQIKASDKKGVLLQRPFACFCIRCRKEEFSSCVHKGFTKGDFATQELPINELEIENEEKIEGVTEFNTDEYFYEDENDVENQDIDIIDEKHQLEDLKLGDYLIAKVSADEESMNVQKNPEFSYFVAKIVALDADKEIGVDYLEQDEEHREKFRFSQKINELDRDLKLTDIMMILPEPCKLRYGVLFPRRINLKK